MKILYLCGLGMVLLTACSNPRLNTTSNSGSVDLDSLNQTYYCTPPEDLKNNMLQLINQARSTPRSCGSRYYGVAPAVVWSQRLAVAAKAHSDDMIQNNFFDHRGSDGSEVSERVRRAGYRFRRIAENIQAGADTPATAMASLLKSPSHCEAIMSPEYQEVGVSCSRRSATTYVTYYSQVFGTQL